MSDSVSRLSEQMDMMARNQRHANTVLIQSSQPSAFLGVPMWQLIGAAGTMGVVYFKVKGYNLNDLVYVSKQHFNSITDILKEQIGLLETTMGDVKQELLERIGLVEAKVDSAKESIEARIAAEMSKVDGNMDKFGLELGAVKTDVAESRNATRAIASDVTSVKSDMGHFKDHLSKMSSAVGLHTTKLDDLSLALAENLGKQSRGIDLLCKYVVTQGSSTDSSTQSQILEELREFASFEQPPSVSKRSSQTNALERRGLMRLAGIPSRVQIDAA